MIDFRLFDLAIEANNNPFKIHSKQVFKINGEVKINNLVETIDLVSVTSIIDEIIEKSENIEIDFYPKNILQRIYKKLELGVLSETEHDFILVNNITKQKLSKKGVNFENTYDLVKEDVLIFGKRGRIVYMTSENTTEVNFDYNLFKVVKLI